MKAALYPYSAAIRHACMVAVRATAEDPVVLLRILSFLCLFL
jgi:hypothetical protein